MSQLTMIFLSQKVQKIHGLIQANSSYFVQYKVCHNFILSMLNNNILIQSYQKLQQYIKKNTMTPCSQYGKLV